MPDPGALADPSRPEVASQPRLVAALGDSITAGSPLWDPNPSQRADDGSADERSQFEYWAERELDGFEFRNCGVWGERTDEIAARFDACVEGAEILIVQGGINNIVQGEPIGPAVSDLRAMVERGKALGLETYLVDVLPWNNGYPQAVGPINALNRKIARLAADEEVPLIGFHDILEDPAAPDRMRPDLTIEGDHPSIAGYRLLGLEVANALSLDPPAANRPK